jgi:hypothetical protein
MIREYYLVILVLYDPCMIEGRTFNKSFKLDF